MFKTNSPMNEAKIEVVVKDRNGNFVSYKFLGVNELRNTCKSKDDEHETIYFVNINGVCVYSYLIFRCLSNYTEGLNWGKLTTLM